jgi:phosphatidylinositol alpha-mannosyltransferase
LARGFRSLGHDVQMIAPGPPGAKRGTELLPLGRAFPFPSGGSLARVTVSPWLGVHVQRLLARERFDIIHIHEPLISSLTLFMLRYAQTLTAGTFHAARESGRSRGYALAQLFLRPLAERLDGRIAVSPAAARLAGRYFPGRYEIIPNGVDVGRFTTPLPRPPTLPERYVLFLGRLEGRKGLGVMLRAFAILKRRLPHVHLVVGGDGQARARYERWVAQQGVADVHFMGRLAAAELPAYYQHAAVYCAPNTGNESFGIVLLEAMAAGCPVVASAIEGFRVVITHERDGLLVPPHDPAALADALERVLTDHALAGSLTTAGTERAREFDWPRIVTRVLAYYQGLAAAGPPCDDRVPLAVPGHERV